MRRQRAFAVLVLLAVLAFGCGNGSPGTDAGDVDPADDGGFDVLMPTPPAPPVLTPCPEGWVEVPPDEPDGVTTCDPWPDGGPAVLTPCPDGWREVTDPETGTVTCDPWPETGYEECTAVDEAHFPGEPGCIRVGTACPPDDDWAIGLPGDRPIRYVLAGAPAGGDGTRASPFGTIQDAMSGAAAGTVVALSKGTFDEVVVLGAGVTLWGACVAETLVASSVPAEDAGTLNVRGRDVGVRNLRVSGRRPGIWASGAFRTAVLQEVVVDEATTTGVVAAEDAILTGGGVAVRGTRSRESDATLGRGLEARTGAQVDLSRVLLERNRELGVAVFHASTSLRLTDTAIRETLAQERTQALGQGLRAQEGAHVVMERAAFEQNRDAGAFVTGAATTVQLVDLVVRDTRSQQSDRTRGRGLDIQQGAEVAVQRALIERNRRAGIAVGHAGTTVRLTDIVIRDTQSQEADQMYGRGLEAREGPRVEMERATVERNRLAGIAVGHAGTTVRLIDVVVRDTRSQECDRMFGRGLQVQEGAEVDVSRTVLQRNRDVGVIVGGVGTVVRLTDVVVRDTGSQEENRLFGRGLTIQDGARVEATRVVIERNLESGVGAAGPGTTLQLANAVVRNTMASQAFDNFGTGVGVYGGAHAELRGFLVTGNALCGLQLAHGTDPDTGVRSVRGGSMDLYDGVVSHNAVCGANVQTDGFDLRRLQNNVRWHDNGIDLDMSELPVPDLGAAGM